MLILSLIGSALAGTPEPGTRFVADQPKTQIDATLEAAVDKTVSGFSWALRPLARPRLEPLATACPAYTFHIQGDEFRVRCDGKDAFTWQAGHSGPWTSKEGETVTVSLTRSGTTWALDFSGDNGGKVFTYAFQGSSLTVTQKVYSDKMPEPMVWTLTYSKDS